MHLSIWRPVPGSAAPARSGPAADAATTSAAAPVLVWIHGGGWVGGNDLGPAAALTRWAERGWLVVSVEYGLDSAGHPTWDRAGPEVACALDRVAGQAASLGGDPSRIVLGGDSAGGQLAVSVAYHAASGTQASSCGSPVPVPRAVAVEYPAVDLVDGYEHGARSPVPQFDARWLAATYTGGSPVPGPRALPRDLGHRRAESRTPRRPWCSPPPATASSRSPACNASSPRRARDRRRRLPGHVPFADHAFDVVDGSLGAQAASSVLQHWAATRVGAP